MEKKLLRQQALKQRKSLNSLEVQGRSHEIAQRLLFLPEYQKAQNILVYMSFDNEVDTRAIITNAWQQKKRVLVPICHTSDKSMQISELCNFSELAPGTWGIPEPKKDCLRLAEPAVVDAAIIPGVAFDKRGYRLGHGGGYYDRFLTKLAPGCPKIALAYEFMIREYLPNEIHDVPMDYIVTEKEVYKIN